MITPTGALEIEALLASPEYVATMLCEPTVRLAVTSVACPLGFGAIAPIGLPLPANVTLPVAGDNAAFAVLLPFRRGESFAHVLICGSTRRRGRQSALPVSCE